MSGRAGHGRGRAGRQWSGRPTCPFGSGKSGRGRSQGRRGDGVDAVGDEPVRQGDDGPVQNRPAAHQQPDFERLLADHGVLILEIASRGPAVHSGDAGRHLNAMNRAVRLRLMTNSRKNFADLWRTRATDDGYLWGSTPDPPPQPSHVGPTGPIVSWWAEAIPSPPGSVSGGPPPFVGPPPIAHGPSPPILVGGPTPPLRAADSCSTDPDQIQFAPTSGWAE